jgi:hypothetical protein
MSVFLTGVTFANRKVAPGDDAAVYASALSDGIATGCEMSRVGSTLHIGSGKVVACGRVARIPAAQDIPVTGASSGYARLVLTVDLSRSSTETVFEQVALDVQYAQTIGAFPALTQEDINNGGTTYQFVLCMMELSNAGIASILWTCGKAHGKANGVSVTLPASGWSNNAQTVYVDGVTATSNVVATYAPSSRDAYNGAGVYLAGQGDGTLTFACDDTPGEQITANVLML